MLLSMTGYGKGHANFMQREIRSEIRSLNSKLTDIRIRMPLNLGDKEMALRKLIHERAMRGKLEITVSFSGMFEEEAGDLNTAVIRKYYTELRELAKGLDVSNDSIFQSILKLPNVIKTESELIDSALWESLCQSVEEALINLNEFRRNEGKSLEKDLKDQAVFILNLLDAVTPHEADRMAYMRERLNQRVTEYLSSEYVDENRFEQEMAFYLDKLDINEEKVRLQQHCEHFLLEIENDDVLKGRKLNFISQEMGREINTLGSKAQWSAIQKIVVEMKTSLDKIKEQVANTL